jgi:ATP-dependent Clp protease adaptor protein ClpS
MSDITTRPKAKDDIKVERPRLHNVILVNGDYAPREFVVTVLKGEFRMSEDQALRASGMEGTFEKSRPRPSAIVG